MSKPPARSGQNGSSDTTASGPRSSRYKHALRSLDFMQVLLFMQTVQVGVGLFNLPRVVSEAVGHDGWVSILIAGAGTQVALLFMILLLRRFQRLDVYEIMRRIFGRWIGNTLGLFFALYCISAAALVSRSYIEVVQTWLFPTTSTMMFYLLLLVPCVYCATAGPRVIGQFSIVTFIATIWMLFALIVPARQMEFINFRPFFEASPLRYLHGAWQVSASMIGFELILVFYPFVQRKDKALLASSLGIWLTTLIYFLVTLAAIGFYSQPQIVTIISPTLHMFKIFQIPLIERIEQIAIATWSFLIVQTATAYIWGAGRYLHSFGRWKEPTCVYLVAPLLFVLAIFPQDIFLLNKFETYLGTLGGIVTLTLGPLLLITAILLRKKGDGDPQAHRIEEVDAS
jgi:spore germination protein (amino acid permease)